MLLIPLQTKYNISSQVGLAYLSVVIDLLFTGSLMLLQQLNHAVGAQEGFTSRKTQPECQGMPLPPGQGCMLQAVCATHLLGQLLGPARNTQTVGGSLQAEKEHCLFQMCLLAHVP